MLMHTLLVISVQGIGNILQLLTHIQEAQNNISGLTFNLSTDTG